MSKKHKHYPSAREMFAMYKAVQEGSPMKAAKDEANISFSSASRLYREMRGVLGGGKPVRRKGREELLEAVGMIKGNGFNHTTVEEHTTVFSDSVSNPEEKLGKVWEELQGAIGDYVDYMVAKNTEQIHSEYKTLKEEAGKSNIVGFLRNRWGR